MRMCTSKRINTVSTKVRRRSSMFMSRKIFIRRGRVTVS